MPNTANVEPSRIKLLNDIAEPKLIKSSSAIDDPRRVMPKTDKVEPSRMKLRNEIDDPRML